MLLCVGLLHGQKGLKPEMTPKVNKLVPFQIDPYIALVKGCDDKVDVYVKLKPIIGQDKNAKSQVSANRILITPLNKLGKRKTLYSNNVFEAEFYGLEESEKRRIDFNVKAYDTNNKLILDTNIGKSTVRDGHVEVSEELFAIIYDMGHEDPVIEKSLIRGPGPGPDVFTYFCGIMISKIELLAFYQDFLGLSPFEICQLVKEFERQNIEYQESGSITWTGKYCDLLNNFWSIYKTGGTLPDGECECKVINSSVFVDHSVGETSGSALENCPDVSVAQGYEIWSHEGGSPTTDESHNWLVTEWATMGAAKSMYTVSHHYEGGDENSNMEFTLNNSELKSGIQFSMKCFDPGDASIDEDCDCEKDIIFSAQYVSRIRGEAGTDGNGISAGNGEVRSCMEDFAFLTKFTRDDFEMVESGGAISCVECESSDSTNFLTDLGTLASAVEGIVPTVIDTGGFQVSKIDDYFNSAGQVADLLSNAFSVTPDCGDFKDTTYTLIQTSDTHKLNPKNDFVAYVLSSRVFSATDFVNDESWSELHLVSDFYIAAGLESSGDSNCCHEKVGGYAIGNLGDFSSQFTANITGENVTYDGYDFKINDPLKKGFWLEDPSLYKLTPNSLERLQRDVAQTFTLVHPDFLKDVFGLDCGPGCSVDIDCYYNCGYYGECHETSDGGEGFSVDPNINVRMKKNSVDKEVKIYPNPIDENGSLYIEFEKNVYQEIFVLNLDGELLNSFPIQSSETDQVVVDKMDLNIGVNIILLKAINGRVVVHRVVRI